MLNNIEYLIIPANGVDFEYGFVSFRDKEWVVSDTKINQIIMNRKLKKIKF